MCDQNDIQTPARVRVTAERTYDVVIGRQLLGELPGLLGTSVRKVLIVHTEALEASAAAVREDLLAQGYEALLAVIPDAEGAKSIDVVAFCWQVLGQSDFTRSDAIVSIGGGATTDVAGFIAATWLRGIQVVHIPTTLLAMVDAAVGGKTGINTAEGKNLVGSFHEPAGVLCDLDALATLPRLDLVAGLAAVGTAGRIAAPRIVTPSPDRVRPVCAHYRACGGCSLMHASDDFVACWKGGVFARA